jgi:hypothetical protein
MSPEEYEEMDRLRAELLSRRGYYELSDAIARVRQVCAQPWAGRLASDVKTEILRALDGEE